MAIEALLNAVGQRVPEVLPARPREGNLKLALVRKTLVANLAYRDTQVDWEAVPAAHLSMKALGPDLGRF